MNIKYIDKRFSSKTKALIGAANLIIAEYEAQGFELTLRQLYYQFVARGLIPNEQREYKNLGAIINDGRLAGEISWTAIVDRTRNLVAIPHWESPFEIVKSCAAQFAIDKWADQKNRVEVWIEKDALVGVIEKACRSLDVPFFSCRGYTSQSEMWAASQRLLRYKKDGQRPVIVHLGDHDPSGKDMTRDIQDRLHLFAGEVEVNRIALTMAQIEEYNPPPNPAKLTDSRATQYVKEFGNESWELDALDPKTVHRLITKTVGSYMNGRKWKDAVKVETGHRKRLTEICEDLRDE